MKDKSLQRTKLKHLANITNTLNNITYAVCHQQTDSSLNHLDSKTIETIHYLIRESDQTSTSLTTTSNLIHEICDLIAMPSYQIKHFKKKQNQQTQQFIHALERTHCNSEELINLLHKSDALLLEDIDYKTMSEAERNTYLSNKKKQLYNYLHHLKQAKQLPTKNILLTVLNSILSLIRITAHLIFDDNPNSIKINTPNSALDIEKIKAYTHPEILNIASNSLTIEDLIAREIGQGGSIFETYLHTIAHGLNINWERFGIHAQIEHAHNDNNHLVPDKKPIFP